MKLNATITNLKNKVVSFEDAIRLEDILKQVKDELPYPVYLAKLDNAYRALTHITEHDCSIEFLDLRNQEAWLVYQNSLILIFIKAVHDLFGKKVLITVNNSLNKGLYITSTHKFSQEDIDKVKARMNEIIEADLPIRKEHLTKEGARVLARKQKLQSLSSPSPTSMISRSILWMMRYRSSTTFWYHLPDTSRCLISTCSRMA